MEPDDLEYCPVCDDYFPVDTLTGEIDCDCLKDPYKFDSTRELDFND